MEGEKYCIGKVEKICKITKKTLRYYDKIGLLSPSEIIESNGYRYYDKNNLYLIPVIKYYKQSGFKLESIKKLIYNADFEEIEDSFKEKIHELEEEERKLMLKKSSIEDWYSLVKEARMVIENNLTDITVKYCEEQEMVFLDQEYNYDYTNSIINIEFTNYVEKINNAITGAVMMKFPSFEEKMEGKCKKVKIIQKNLIKTSKEKIEKFEGGFYISCYYIGPHSGINSVYLKLKKWLENKGCEVEESCYERYVIDYWTSKDENKFVTEILIKMKDKKH